MTPVDEIRALRVKRLSTYYFGWNAALDRAAALAEAHESALARLICETEARGMEMADDWQSDPAASAAWNAGCDFAMTSLCKMLNVDPNSISWDAATEELEGDVMSVIGNIMREAFGDDWHTAILAAAEKEDEK